MSLQEPALFQGAEENNKHYFTQAMAENFKLMSLWMAMGNNRKFWIKQQQGPTGDEEPGAGGTLCLENGLDAEIPYCDINCIHVKEWSV